MARLKSFNEGQLLFTQIANVTGLLTFNPDRRIARRSGVMKILIQNTVVQATSGNTVNLGRYGFTSIDYVAMDQRHRGSATAVTATYANGTATLQLAAGSIDVNTVGLIVIGRGR